MKTIYQDIKNTIVSDLEEIKGVHLWNNQIRNLKDGKEHLADFPRVYISFEDIQYSSRPKNLQVGECNIIVRLYDRHLEHDEEAIFDLRDKVYYSLQNLKLTDYYSSLTRISENMDGDYDSLIGFTTTYRCSFTSEEAYKIYSDVTGTTLQLIKLSL
jgi:hypothetical protein